MLIGKVTCSGSLANYTVSKKNEIKTIIDIFSVNPINKTKQDNFLSFKKAFECYIETKNKSPFLINNVQEIIGNMNSLRSELKSL